MGAVSRYSMSAGLLCAAIVCGCGSAGRSASSPEAGSTLPTGKSTPESAIAWLSGPDEALRLAKATGKPVLLAFGAHWCSACRMFRSRTLPSPEVQGMAEAFHWVFVDIDRNLSLARAYNVRAAPQFHLIDPAGNTRVRVEGHLPAAAFRAQLDAFLKGLKAQHEESEEPALELAGDLKTPLTWSPDGRTYRGHAICFSNVGYGPLNLTAQAPFQALRLNLSPRTPSTLAKGSMEVRAAETWVNVWAYDAGLYMMDYEMLRSHFTLGYGVTDAFQLEMALVNCNRFSGVMDGFVEGFHDLFGLGQLGRDLFPRNDFRIFISGQGVLPDVDLGDEAQGSFARTLQLTCQHNVTCGTAYLPALSYSVTFETDVGGYDNARGGRDFALGTSVAVARRLGEFHLYMSAGFNWYGAETFHGIPLRSTQLSGLWAVEWRYRPRTSLVVQYLLTEGVARDLIPFSRPSHEVIVGWKTELTEGTVLELGLIEGVFAFQNSPSSDVGFHLGFAGRF